MITVINDSDWYKQGWISGLGPGLGYMAHQQYSRSKHVKKPAVTGAIVAFVLLLLAPGLLYAVSGLTALLYYITGLVALYIIMDAVYKPQRRNR